MNSLALPRILSTGCALLLLSSLPALAVDWPGFRGAHRDDVCLETALLAQWPEAGPKKLWMSTEAGLGYAGYSIAQGRLYTMGLHGDSEDLMAFDAASGKLLWTTPVGPIFTNKWGDGPRGTPFIDEDRVYTLSAQGYVLCASAKDGKPLWNASLKDFGGKPPGWGYTESVLVDGNRLLLTPGGPSGTVLALDKMTGKKLWQSADWTDPAQYGSIVPATINGIAQYVVLTMQNVGAVEAATGKKLWLSPWNGRTAVIPTPVVSGNEVYISSGYSVGCKKVRISSGNQPEDLWTNTHMINHHGGVILHKGYLYGYSDKSGWTCQDWSTGEVKWAEKKLGKGAIHCANGQLVLLDEKDGTVALIDASPDGWKEHGRFKLDPQTTQRKPDGRIWTHPVISDGRLYLRDQELLFCFDVSAPAKQ
jgi:outer membrane protein assembly factor BamB